MLHRMATLVAIVSLVALAPHGPALAADSVTITGTVSAPTAVTDLDGTVELGRLVSEDGWLDFVREVEAPVEDGAFSLSAEPGYYAAMFSARPPEGEAAGAPPDSGKGPEGDQAFDLLVKGLEAAFPDGFGSVDPRFLALEVWALSHGIATLAAAGQLPRTPGLPDKFELLRAGVVALVQGAVARAGAEAPRRRGPWGEPPPR